MKGQVDTYKETKVYTYPNMVIRVHTPDLTDDERKRRMKNIEKAAEALLKGGRR